MPTEGGCVGRNWQCGRNDVTEVTGNHEMKGRNREADIGKVEIRQGGIESQRGDCS